MRWNGIAIESEADMMPVKKTIAANSSGTANEYANSKNDDTKRKSDTITAKMFMVVSFCQYSPR